MYLDFHNEKRSDHEVLDLRFSQDLADDAQAYAEEMQSAYDASGKDRDNLSLYFRHSDVSTRSGQGENLGYNEFIPADDTQIRTTTFIAEAWYNEVEFYDFDNPGVTMPPGEMVGHFTAMVWRDSCELGCGVTENFVVCRYSPPGNFLTAGGTYDLFLENVCPIGEKCY